ncbi:MAG: 30S ribosomal protein S8 [Bacilli bacterium]
MSMTDPIAAMLTSIRNANKNKSKTTVVPSSKIKLEIARILKEEGFIADYKEIETGIFKEIEITLKYVGSKKERIITNLKRISKPGLRVYADSSNMPKVLSGLGISIISTSTGLMTGKEARKKNIGGEVIAYVW